MPKKSYVIPATLIPSATYIYSIPYRVVQIKSLFLIGDYDKYTVHTEKNIVILFSVHMDISFHNNNSGKK